MLTATVFACGPDPFAPKYGVRFDTQILPNGSWVVAFLRQEPEGVLQISGYESTTPTAAEAIRWATEVLESDGVDVPVYPSNLI
jgi:hypothetical protein